jgi:hypothetical protein
LVIGENMDSSELENEIARGHIPTIMNQIGRLDVRDDVDNVIASGTGTLVDVYGQKLIITAHHVAKRLAAYPHGISLFVYPPADVIVANPNTAYDLPSFPIHPQDLIILPQGESLDVAAFRAPRDLAAVPHLRWIDASAQVSAVEYLRSEYQKDELPFCLVIAGFPNFGRATDTSRRIQLFSNFQCWCYLRQFIDTPPILVGNGAPAPQFSFEVELPVEDGLPDDATELIRWFTRIIHAESAGDYEPIGGFSGAPVFFPSSTACSLIGITKEGRSDLGGLMFATTISDIILEIRNAHVLG